MAECTYLLCAATSLLCAYLLIRAYVRRRVRILLSCTFCFVGLAASNILLVLDLIVFPSVNLYPLRTFVMLLG